MLPRTPSPSLLLKRGIIRGLKLLRRERQWGTSFGSLLGVFLLVQLLFLVLLGMGAALDMLRYRTDLRLEIRDAVERTSVQLFVAALEQLPAVDKVSYLTKEQTYAQAQEDEPELISFLEEFKLENPFADSVSVTLKSLDDYPAFRAFIEEARWSGVIDPAFLSQVTDQEQNVSTLVSIAGAVQSLTMLLLLIAGGVLLLTIIELTRRHAERRHNEVLIERLLGAHTIAIFTPFATEMTLLMWMSVLFSSLLLLGFLVVLPLILPELRGGGPLFPLQEAMRPSLLFTLPILLLLEILTTPALAGLGAWLGIRKRS